MGIGISLPSLEKICGKSTATDCSMKWRRPLALYGIQLQKQQRKV
jgi:hypothetical protein